MTQTAHCDWPTEGATWSHLARSGLPAVSRKKNFPESHIINPLLTKFVRSRWLDIGLVFLLRVRSSTSSRSINTQKRTNLVPRAFPFYLFSKGKALGTRLKKELGQYLTILTSHLVNNITHTYLFSVQYPHGYHKSDRCTWIFRVQTRPKD